MSRYSSKKSVPILASSIGCTELEAGELLTLADTFSTRVRNLPTWYRAEYVADTRKHIEALREFAGKDRLGRMIGSKPSLPGMAAGMWKNYREADKAFDAFSQANAIHQTGLDANRALTACLEALNASRELSQPEKTLEGRRLYESLRAHSSLLDQIEV